MLCWTGKGKHSEGIFYPHFSVQPLQEKADSHIFLGLGLCFQTQSGNKCYLSLVFQSEAIISTDVNLVTPAQIFFQNMVLLSRVPVQWLHKTGSCLTRTEIN